MRPAKQRRRNALQSLAETRISEAGLSRILSKLTKQPALINDLGTSSSKTMSMECSAMAADILHKIGTEVQLPMESGTVHILKIATPQAVLSHFVDCAPAFREVVQITLDQRPLPWRMVLYHDEISGGNVLRPDNRRKVCAIYATFLEFGQLLRNELMWLPIATIKHDTTSAAAGQLSGVLNVVFKRCFGGDSLEAGCMLQLREPRLLLFKVSNLLADEAALKATWSVKGASGIKPCLLCKNVVAKGTLKQLHHAYLVEVGSTGPFDYATNEDWYEIADHVAAQAAVVNRGQLELLEKAAGLNFNRHGLMFDPEMRRIIEPTSSTVDSMHVYFNHGIASNETHAFLDSADKVGFTYKVIHKYLTDAKWAYPSFSAVHALDPARVFTEARARSSKESLKSMAAELLAVLPLIRQLAAITLASCAPIAKELASFEAMCACVDVLQKLKVSPTPSLCKELHRLQVEHLRLHVLAYGPVDHIRPKKHYAFHIGGQILRDGMLLDCFALERKHKAAKQLATTITNGRTFESSILSRLLAAQLASMPESFISDRLLGTKATCPDIAEAIGEESCYVSEHVQCKGMHIAVSDILLVDGQALKVLSCLSCRSGLALLVLPFEFVEKWGHARKWSQSGVVSLFRFTSTVLFPVAWHFDGAVLYTL